MSGQTASTALKLALAVAFAYCIGCGGKPPTTSTTSPPTRTATKITVTYVADSLNSSSATELRCLVGQPLQLKATEYYSDGTTPDITTSSSWSSSSTATATISSAGTVSCLQSGTFDATAQAPDCTSGCTVTPLKGILAAPMFGLTLSLTSPSSTLNIGSSLALKVTESEITATGTVSPDVTSQVGYRSSDVTIATVSAAGVVSGIKAGSVTVTATSPDATLSPVTVALQINPQSLPTLSVSGLTAGAMVQPGTTVSFTITLPQGFTSPALLLPSQDAIQASATPATATFVIPTTYIGKLPLFAVGQDSSQNFVMGSEFDLDVEPNTFPTISSNLANLNFMFVGDQESIAILATQGNYSGMLMNGSSQLSFASADATIATVDPGGKVTAIAPGTTNITVTLGTHTLTLPVKVPQLIAGDLDGNGFVDYNDMTILTRYLGVAATTTNDARDLNHDGKIDNSDITLIRGICGNYCN